MLTGQPNYPDGKVFSGFSAATTTEEKHKDGYTIYRVPLIPRGRATVPRLIANYVSFVISATVFGPWLLRGAEFDVVFVYAPSPILQVIPAIVMKWLKRAPLVTWVQDLWPQSLESTGFVTNHHVLRLVERLVGWIYRRNDFLLGQSRSFVTSIRKLSGRTPVEYFPNPGEGIPGEDQSTSSPALVLDPGFNVVFAGNLGTVQSLDTVLDAAELLRAERQIRFVLIGSGSRSGWLKSEVERRQLENVQLPGRLGADQMSGVMAQASVLLVSLIRSPIMSQTIPSKIQAYLAAARPIIASLDGEGAQVVIDAGAGVSVPAEDARALADAVLKVRALSDIERSRMGEAGARFYQRHFDPEVLAQQLIAHFRIVVNRDGGSAPLKASA
ncbi:MAG: glycosyltransferase family 4 protein [Gemmatimonadota bacterium]|nr:glycosyltransferase family 4 protein [Gemmatimonadota bacterium]